MEKVEIKAVASDRFVLTKQDVEKWGQNLRAYLAPLGLIYIGAVIPSVMRDGFQLNDLIVDGPVTGAMALYLLNSLYDLFSKWSDEKKYVKVS
jgi:hypothetical protein